MFALIPHIPAAVDIRMVKARRSNKELATGWERTVSMKCCESGVGQKEKFEIKNTANVDDVDR